MKEYGVHIMVGCMSRLYNQELMVQINTWDTNSEDPFHSI